MNSLAPARSVRPGRWPGLALVTAGCLHAFPPAPHHLLEGLVRDELGQPLQANAAVLFETASGTGLQTEVVGGLAPGLNYRLAVPMDAGLTADPYQPTALHPMVPFKVRVSLGGRVFLPIEMQGDFAELGRPARRTRLDLTLGEDTDGDGLPDAWERALIAGSGRPLTLADVRSDDDLDADGLSNLAEYLAGTYAFDPQDGFRLNLVVTGGDATILEFLAIRGRTYTLQGTTELGTWRPLDFRIVTPQPETTPRHDYHALDVRVLRVEALPPGDPQRFFRLRVQ